MKFTKTVTTQQREVFSSVSQSGSQSVTMTVKRGASAHTTKTVKTAAVAGAAASVDGRSEQATPVRRSTSLNVNRECIQDFALVRASIFPVVKSPSWVKTIKDVLAKLDPTNAIPEVLFFPVENIPGSALGYTLAIVDGSGSLHYILPCYLDVWRTTGRVLQELALANMQQKLAAAGDDLWTRSKAGVYYLDRLGSLSASVLLFPRFIEGLAVESGDPVVLAPVSDLCMVTGSQMETQLCIMGDMALRYSNEPHRFELRPLRLSEHVLTDYAPGALSDEHDVPDTFEQVAGLRLRVKPITKRK